MLESDRGEREVRCIIKHWPLGILCDILYILWTTSDHILPRSALGALSNFKCSPSGHIELVMCANFNYGSHWVNQQTIFTPQKLDSHTQCYDGSSFHDLRYNPESIYSHPNLFYKCIGVFPIKENKPLTANATISASLLAWRWIPLQLKSATPFKHYFKEVLSSIPLEKFQYTGKSWSPS